MRFQELRRAPISVTGEWISRRYTTRLHGPEEEYLVWSHVLTFSADVPLRAIQFVTQGGVTAWGRDGWAKGVDTGPIDIHIKFFHRWTETDEVDIHFGRGGRLLSKDVKKDAPGTVALSYPGQVFTGEITKLATVPGEPAAELSILLLHGSDTEDTRLSKWRLTKSLRASLPSELNFLTSGYQSGSLSADLLT